ncbi:MAG: NAD-dependent epimerase/dehydratase family protein [Nitrospinales bacterium]
MKILITGNMGYIGPCLVSHLRTSFPSTTLIGLDMGYFATCLSNSEILPECKADIQYFGDIRKIREDIVQDVDAIVHLSAISNDPMGKTFENVTMDINYRASVELAKKAKEMGVKTFVFASSCSMYGAAEDSAKTEESQLNPLTAYARSKVLTEEGLEKIAGDGFKVTSLRFSTACGMSPRLRLDLVLNDFVAGAIASKQITILSDGTPWRPLINVKDMARAIEWAISRNRTNGGEFLAVNVGSNEWNYQVKDLAYAVAEVIPGIEISINENAAPDKRSYRVNFDYYKKLAPNHQPKYNLINTIEELRDGLEAMEFDDEKFRDSNYMRLNMLNKLRKNGLLNENLEWD